MQADRGGGKLSQLPQLGWQLSSQNMKRGCKLCWARRTYRGWSEHHPTYLGSFIAELGLFRGMLGGFFIGAGYSGLRKTSGVFRMLNRKLNYFFYDLRETK